MFLERSVAHRHRLATKIEQETARTTERQMEIQHRLHRPDQNEERYDGKRNSSNNSPLNKHVCRSMLTCSFHAVSFGKYFQSSSISILSSYWYVQSSHPSISLLTKKYIQ